MRFNPVRVDSGFNNHTEQRTWKREQTIKKKNKKRKKSELFHPMASQEIANITD